ncbi:MAG: hypothetical protein JWO24_663 [Rhodospirillales bacterium]|nr:hypothetical protein [Rhodospirillales bacterium]
MLAPDPEVAQRAARGFQADAAPGAQRQPEAALLQVPHIGDDGLTRRDGCGGRRLLERPRR